MNPEHFASLPWNAVLRCDRLSSGACGAAPVERREDEERSTQGLN
jgi:hypothetical protein